MNKLNYSVWEAFVDECWELFVNLIPEIVIKCSLTCVLSVLLKKNSCHSVRIQRKVSVDLAALR